AGLPGHGDDRGDVDDAAGAPLAHRGQDGAGAQPDPLDVDRERALPDVVGDLRERRELDLAEVGGVVDQAVDLPERVDRGLRHRAGGGGVGHVDRHRDGGAAGGLDEPDGLVRRVHVGDDDVGALLPRPDGKGLADAGGASGDDDRAAGEQVVCGHAPHRTQGTSDCIQDCTGWILARMATVELPQYELYVAGGSFPPANGRFYETADPYTGQPWARVPDASEEDVDRAVGAARTALEGEWGAL